MRKSTGSTTRSSLTFLLLLPLFSFFCFQQASAQTSYANEFIDPDLILAGDFANNTAAAQRMIRNWASKWASEGPWSVMLKDATPPSGTKHDYMSWAPYWWPDCSDVGNTTVLSEEEVWTTCPYRRRDGEFNPDVRGVNDVGNFQDMSDAVLYNALAWSLEEAGKTLTWFLNPDTRMNPNLNFAQMIRGSNGRPGSATGVLDLKGMAKIASAILIFRKGGSTEWTSDDDEQMVEWSREYIEWLETAELALDEGNSRNNHGSFYYNQLAALKLIVDDIPGAINVSSTYFSRQFQSQIAADGEQTNARIWKYADPSSNVWEITSAEGATIKTALDYAMTHSASSSGESQYAAELYPIVAAVASVYGDPDGQYLNFLQENDEGFYAEPYFLWNSGEWTSDVTSTARPGGPKPTSRKTQGSPSVDEDAGSADGRGVRLWGLALNVAVLAHTLLSVVI
ncbi:hypothetical protein CC1G_09521 [Coprinopsis cinerea okayama7|uniref:Alginate lyase domain-containing protein n=1 Tax=Coprinopsis cinerea (strain Okayama-7 / 130 / ATCC MYA-4618 / FGSC 9003) TaxID=240176 RepID=A8P0U9_COPC7|nr:hypothetical protein CC1G_09521 [Coprinopsis cinerea okayama7\|eukprot:XP_001837970.2 hypothetical protein CC1G_09521 [Coprinopsis cinerea okayama7\